MPANTGRMPTCDLVDVTYRNGQVRRAIQPQSRRWAPSEKFPDDWDWDIVRWQPSKG